MTFPKITLSEVRKAAVAICGATAEGLSLGLLHGNLETIATTVLAVATALGVYVVPNKAAKPPVAVSRPATPTIPGN